MFNGNILRDAVLSAANNLSNNRRQIDELNVFPVPDGDTGTNMSMTLSNAVRELEKIDGEPAGKIAAVNASALLRGARGNSGVITSLLFRGFAKGIGNDETVTAANLAEAFKSGVEAAYKAVMKPTEGTILTVARIAAEKADEANQAGKDALGVFEAALDGAREALAQTPELLPMLKKAGVVDAGGQGFVIILEGMLSVFRDGVIIKSNAAASDDNQSEQNENRNAAGEFETEITFTYCTEFIVNRDPECEKEPSELRAYLETIGDCVVVVDDEQIIKVHVHTDHPGNAFENGLTFGSLINMKVENMRDQHERAKHDAKNAKKAPAKTAENEKIESVEITKPVGFVSVCAGDGVAELFRDLGVDTIVSGGQTMNPSTDNILRAIESTPAETVYVLPNNKNIIMAAEQAIPISTRKVIVLHTRTIPQGIAAMLSFDEATDTEVNAIEMQKAAERIATGQVTFAARDSDFDGHKIKQGEIMAMTGGKISFVDTDIERVTVKLVKSMLKRDSEFVTVIYGEDITDEQAASLEQQLNEKFGNKVEITFVNGGQPVYYYIVSVE